MTNQSSAWVVIFLDNKYLRQFKKGALEMVLLSLISQGETYGYEILTRLNKKGADVLGYAKEGTIYPILYRLEDAGLISCRTVPSPSNGGSRKYYSVTSAGAQLLDELLQFWDEYKLCIDSLIGKQDRGV